LVESADLLPAETPHEPDLGTTFDRFLGLIEFLSKAPILCPRATSIGHIEGKDNFVPDFRNQSGAVEHCRSVAAITEKADLAGHVEVDIVRHSLHLDKA